MNPDQEEKETGKKRNLSELESKENKNYNDVIDLIGDDEISVEKEETITKKTKVRTEETSFDSRLDIDRLDREAWLWAHNRQDLRAEKNEIEAHTDNLCKSIVEKYQSTETVKKVKDGALGSRQLYEFICNQLEKENFQGASTVGKWLLMNIPASDIKNIWGKIYQATVDGELGCTSKVGKMIQTDYGQDASATYMICVYTYDFRKKEELAKVLNRLSILGVLVDSTGKQKKISYKIDLLTLAFAYSPRYQTTSISNETFWESKKKEDGQF